jgi:hypothetical protein
VQRPFASPFANAVFTGDKRLWTASHTCSPTTKDCAARWLFYLKLNPDLDNVLCELGCREKFVPSNEE